MDEHMDNFGTQQQRQCKGAVVGVGRLYTSTYYTAAYSTIRRFIINGVP